MDYVQGRLGDRQSEVVAGRLLGGDDQRVEVGRQAPAHQGQVADVPEIDRKQLRRDPLRDLRPIALQAVACREDHLLHAVDREVVVGRQFPTPPLVESGEEGQLAEEEDQRLRLDAERLDRREERLGVRARSSRRM